MKISGDKKTIRVMANITLIVSFIFSIHTHCLFSSHHLNINSSLSSANSYSPADSQLPLIKKSDNILSYIFAEDFELSTFNPQIINNCTESLPSLLNYFSIVNHFKEMVNSKNIYQIGKPRAPPSLESSI